MENSLEVPVRPGWRQLMVGDRSFYGRVVMLVVPLIIQNTISHTVNLLDNLMIGSLGEVPLASVAIVNQLIFVFNLCVFGALSGVSIFVTQFAGAKDEEGLRQCMRVKVCLGIGLSAVAAVVLTQFQEPLIRLYLKGDMPEADLVETVRLGGTYIRMVLWGLPFFALAMMYESTLREVGEVRVPMFASVTAILVNLLFNYLLIFGHGGFPALGVEGAAIATSLSRVVELAITTVYTHTHTANYAFMRGVYRRFQVSKKLLSGIWKRGLPLLFNELCWSVGMSTLMQCFSTRGLSVVAALNIAMTVSMMFNCIFYSMGTAVSVMIGHELGAGELSRARVMAWQLTWLTVYLGIAMAAAMSLSAPWVMRLYNVNAETSVIAVDLMRLMSAGAPFIAFYHAAYFVVRAGGRGLITFLLDSGYTWVILIPATWYVARYTSLPILPFYAISRTCEAFKAVVSALIMRTNVWVRNLVA